MLIYWSFRRKTNMNIEPTCQKSSRLIFSYGEFNGLAMWYYFVASLNNEKRVSIFNHWISSLKVPTNKNIQILNNYQGIGLSNKRIELDPITAANTQQYIDLRHKEVHMTIIGPWSDDELQDLINGLINTATSYTAAQHCRCLRK